MNVRKPLTRSLSNKSICTYFSNTQIVLGPIYEIFRNPKREQEHPWRNQCAAKCNSQEATLSLDHPYFSNPKVDMEPTFGELMTQ